jgi:Zn-dependent peptidase ImmA (M78 family)
MGEVVRQPAMIMSDKQETEANQFAASLLMPEDTVRARAVQFHPPSASRADTWRRASQANFSSAKKQWLIVWPPWACRR